MSCKPDSPVQTQMAVSLLKSPLTGEFHEFNKIGMKSSLLLIISK
ncbi:hypothetical protein BRARA_J00093 [Brassica rapa]|uniref:Uncharacterized protein n=1 Tax=Brassica campestris TaxID=3711 RepID=A0A397XHC5_BRACM|nr:hypothetical protein BRARA_J00093 [Brassica rapa]